MAVLVRETTYSICAAPWAALIGRGVECTWEGRVELLGWEDRTGVRSQAAPEVGHCSGDVGVEGGVSRVCGVGGVVVTFRCS